MMIIIDTITMLIIRIITIIDFIKYKQNYYYRQYQYHYCTTVFCFG